MWQRQDWHNLETKHNLRYHLPEKAWVMLMRVAAWVPATLMFMLATASVQAAETLMPAFGGHGDGYTGRAVRCPHGHFMIGVHGRTGGWVDHFKLVCAEMTYPQCPKFQILKRGVRRDAKFGRSDGGYPGEAICNETMDGVVTGIDFNTAGEDRGGCQERCVSRFL